MRIEIIPRQGEPRSVSLSGALSRTYRNFQRGEYSSAYPIYEAIDLIGRGRTAMNKPNPLLEAFRINRTPDLGSMSDRERFAAVQSTEALEGDMRLFDDIAGFDGILDRSNDIVRFQPRNIDPVIGVLNLQRLVRRQAKEKSIGLFYEYLAGVIDTGSDSKNSGFNNPDAGLWQLLTADYLYMNGRNLIMKFIDDSNRLNPGPKSFSENSDAVKNFRKREHDKWLAVVSGDIIALNAWQRFIDQGGQGKRSLSYAQVAVADYGRKVDVGMRQHDVTEEDLSTGVNPYLALLG